MKCSKCGADLDDNAVFCDLCGSFVMHEEYTTLPNNGYRLRQEKKSRTWIVVILIALTAGVIGTGVGYGIIINDHIKKMEGRMAKPSVNEKCWDKSLIFKLTEYKNNTTYNGNNTAGNTN